MTVKGYIQRMARKHAVFLFVAGLVLAALWVVPARGVVILPEDVDWSKNGYLDPLPLQETHPVFSEPDLVEEPIGPLVRIRLHKPDRLEGGMIRLSDVATIECEDPELLEEISAIELLATPKLGAKEYLFPRRVEAALRRLGLGMGDFEIESADRIMLELPSQSISMEMLEEAINVALNDRATNSAPGEVEAFMIRRPPELHLPPGEMEIEIVDLDRPGCGIRNIQLAFLVDGRKVETRTVAVRVNHRIYGLVASRNLAAGEILLEEDLKEGLVPLRDRSADESPIEEANLLVGATLKRGVGEGEPVTVADIEWEPLARQGSQVTLVQSIGSVRLTAPGVLMEDMYQIGQTVRVRKANSRKQIFGVATSEKAIRVE